MSGSCIECKKSSQCPEKAPFCVRNSCAQCLINSDCDQESSDRYCIENKCKPCSAAAPSANEYCKSLNTALPACNALSGQCVECTDSFTGCTADEIKPICSSETNQCSACTGDDECMERDGSKPVCNLITGQCMECNNNSLCNSNGSTTSCYQNLCSLPIQCLVNNVLEGYCVEKAEDCNVSGGVFPLVDLGGQCPSDTFCCVSGSALELCISEGNCGSLPSLAPAAPGDDDDDDDDGSPSTPAPAPTPVDEDEDEESFCERCNSTCLLK
jgi:hypothetical protein